MAEKFVIVHRSYDPILIEHIGEMLREAGVAARVIGTRDAALIGIGSSINELHISVPHSQADEATDFLEAFFSTSGEELLDEQGLLDEGDDDDQEEGDSSEGRERALSPALAGVAVLFCGLGHVYARRRVTGAVLAASFVLAIVATPALERATGIEIWDGLGFALVVLLLADLIGGQFAIRAYNRGVRRGAMRQAVVAGLYVAIAFVASQLPTLGRPLDVAFEDVPSFRDAARALDEQAADGENLFRLDLGGLVSPAPEGLQLR